MSIEKFTPPQPETKRAAASLVDKLQTAALARLNAEDTEKGVRELMPHQEDFVGRFIEYFRAVMESRERGSEPDEPRMARIESAPRTGKTTIAAEILRRTDLPSVFFVPTTNLIHQAARELELLLPEKKIVKYTGKEKGPIEEGDVVVATYQMGQADVRAKGIIPETLRDKPLVFADEGHTSTTEKRLILMREQFDQHAIRVALTGTPDYNEKRQLQQYYPDLIHRMTTPEAVELGLLSPFRYWIYEIDLDGSQVSVEGGDYDAGQISRLLTGLPIFKLIEQIRFHPDNKNTPALITFRTKQQAYDVASYLERVKPAGAKSIDVVTEDTKDRENVLQRYADGKLDTLITVQVLISGWDSPRCKLLVDVDPTTSAVRAGQKFTRPLTRRGVEDQSVAKIFSVIPSNLRYPPLLPPDLLLNSDIELSPGTIVGKHSARKTDVAKPIIPLPEKIENIPVHLLSSVREYGGLKAFKIDQKNHQLLHAIVIGGYKNARDHEKIDEQEEEDEEKIGLIELLHSYRNFQNTFFQHAAFRGYGRVLLWSLGIKDKEGFENFVHTTFPEHSATLLLMKNQMGTSSILYRNKRRKTAREMTTELSVAEDAQRLIDTLYRRDNLPEVQSALRALFGPLVDHDISPNDGPDPLLLRSVMDIITHNHPRNITMLLQRIVEGKTYEEIGNEYGLDKERASDIIHYEIERIRSQLRKRYKSLAYLEKGMGQEINTELNLTQRNRLHAGLEKYFISKVKKPTNDNERAILQLTVSGLIYDLHASTLRYLFSKIVEERFPDEISFVEGLTKQDVANGDLALEQTASLLAKKFAGE